MNQHQPAIIPAPRKLRMSEGTASSHGAVSEAVLTDMQEDAYRIQISEKGIAMEAGGKTGLQYAHDTLQQIKMQYGDSIPCMQIEDAPEKPYRAFHLDSSRHFISVAQLKKMIRMCAFFKLNTFHWHFSDDQGWRIESKVFPRLHEVGARRRGDNLGDYFSDKEDWHYYTQEEVRDLVSYCEALGIEVIPDIDTPGHVTAILAAYPHLSCTGERVEVAIKGGVFHDILCAGKEETFRFLETLLDEICDLFPGRYVHIGGDEAPKTRWEVCPLCRKRMEEENLATMDQLQGYFNNRVARYLKTKGKTAIVWNEATLGGNLDEDLIVQLWKDGRIPGSRYNGAGKTYMARGGRVVSSPANNTYTNYPYGYLPLKKVYATSLKPYGMKPLSGDEESRVLGTTCHLWSEFYRGDAEMEYQAWPRFAAVAEIAWWGRAPETYRAFEKRLKTIFPVFAAHGIQAGKPEVWNPKPRKKWQDIRQFFKNSLANNH